MKRFHQLTVLILAAVMALSLAACGGTITVRQPRPDSH